MTAPNILGNFLVTVTCVYTFHAGCPELFQDMLSVISFLIISLRAELSLYLEVRIVKLVDLPLFLYEHVSLLGTQMKKLASTRKSKLVEYSQGS